MPMIKMIGRMIFDLACVALFAYAVLEVAGSLAETTPW